MMKIRYHITMNNSTEFNVSTNHLIDMTNLSTARWYSFRLDNDQLIYLNIAQISSIEVMD